VSPGCSVRLHHSARLLPADIESTYPNISVFVSDWVPIFLVQDAYSYVRSASAAREALAKQKRHSLFTGLSDVCAITAAPSIVLFHSGTATGLLCVNGSRDS